MRLAFKDSQLQQQFSDTGYVVLQLLDESQVKELQEVYNSFSDQELEKGFHTSIKSQNQTFKKAVFEKFEDVFKNKVSEYLIDYKLVFAHYLIKEKETSFKFDLHVDATTLDETKYSAVTIWCSLEAMDSANGALYVWNGGHKHVNNIRSVSVHHPVPEDLVEHLDQNKKTHTLYLKPGEAIIMDQRLPHGSMPNTTNKRRVAAGLHLIPQESTNLMCFDEEQDKIGVYEVGDNSFYYSNYDGDDGKISDQFTFLRYTKSTSLAEELQGSRELIT